jgi:hypothetical protein
MEGYLYANKKLVIFVNKAEQDLEQTYIENTAKRLKKDFGDILTGIKWFEEKL